MCISATDVDRIEVSILLPYFFLPSYKEMKVTRNVTELRFVNEDEEFFYKEYFNF